MHLLGVDVGTTACKAVIFDETGRVVASASHEYGVLTDESGKAEQDAAMVWNRVKDVVRRTSDKSGAGNDVEAIGISVQGDAVIPVDRNLTPLHNAILGMDYRSEPQARACEERLGGKTLFRLTGMRPHPMNSLCKILWLREHDPGAFERAWKIVTYADYTVGLMTGSPVIDHSMASRTMAFELERRCWSEDILGKLDVDPNLFCEAVPCGRQAGTLRPELADELGLSPTAVVAPGGHDQVCAGVGAGVIREGLGVVSTGTAEVLSTAFDTPRLGDAIYEAFYPCYLHARDGMYFTFSLNHVGGLLLQWYRDSFAIEEVREAERSGRGVFGLIDERAVEARSPVLVLPHFNGSGTPICDTRSRGAIVGLSLSTTRHHVARAILESQSFELRLNVETMAASGIEVQSLRAVGGGSRSPLWLQIKADSLGRPVSTLRVSEAACLGAALLAGTAAGSYADVDEAVAVAVAEDRTFEPSGDSYYEEKYRVYRDLYAALAPISRRL
jgi:xylulokinase